MRKPGTGERETKLARGIGHATERRTIRVTAIAGHSGAPVPLYHRMSCASSPGDPWCDVILSHVVGHDTRYTAGYSEGKWRGLRARMTTSEVEMRMGPPLRKMQYDGDHTVWWYSESPRGSDYWMRAVSFQGGAAEYFIGGFYLD